MLELGAFGVRARFRSVAVGDDPDTRAALLQQATAVTKVSGRATISGSSWLPAPAATDPRGRYGQLLEQLRAVFGTTFVRAAEDSPVRPLPPRSSTLRCTRARNSRVATLWRRTPGSRGTRACATRSARLGACLRTAEVLGTGDKIKLTWHSCHSMRPSAGWDCRAARTVRICRRASCRSSSQSSAPIDATKVMSRPVRRRMGRDRAEREGDDGDSRSSSIRRTRVAPQNVLIAVPPVPGQDWTTETSARVLMETLDLAKLRAVDASRWARRRSICPRCICRSTR